MRERGCATVSTPCEKGKFLLTWVCPLQYNRVNLERKVLNMPDAPSKKKWDAANVRIMTVKFMRKKDQDVIDYLEGRNKHDVICAALREYMENHKEETK